MIVALAALALGTVLGLAAGGSFQSLGRMRLRFDWLIVALFLVQGAARGRILGNPIPSATVVWVASSVALVALLLSNYPVPGMLAAGVGTLLNVNATLLNSGMPVLVPTPGPAADMAIRGSAGLYSALNMSTIWGAIGDVIRLDALGQSLLLSIGDVLLVAGICVTIVAGMSGQHFGASAGAARDS